MGRGGGVNTHDFLMAAMNMWLKKIDQVFIRNICLIYLKSDYSFLLKAVLKLNYYSRLKKQGLRGALGLT